MNEHRAWQATAALNQAQRQAGVDPEVAELVTAYARLQYDRGISPVFYDSISQPNRKWEDDFLCGWLVRKNPGMDERITDFLWRYSKAMAAQGLPVIFCADHLANKLRMGPRRLWWMARNMRRCGVAFSIPKKNGGTRAIWAPTGKLLTIQQWILRRVLDKVKVADCVYGFVKGRSIVDNASRHINRRIVMRLDIEDFFPSIHFRQIRKVFQSLGYPYRVANLLANLCTVDGRLPQGAPTSPALSNLVFARVDRRLMGLARSHGFTYTRYADDLVFSSDNEKLPKLIPFIREILRKEGYAINPDKIRIMGRGQRQMVTGLVVNEGVGLPRERKRLLRAMVHRAMCRGVEAVEWVHDPDKDAWAVLQGQLAFARMVAPNGMWREQFALAACGLSACPRATYS